MIDETDRYWIIVIVIIVIVVVTLWNEKQASFLVIYKIM